MSTYTFYLSCPKCNKQSTHVQNRYTRPRLKCGDCLLDHVELVDLKVIAVDRPYGEGVIRDRHPTFNGEG